MSSVRTHNDASIPHMAGVVDRPRLLAQLQAASSHKLTLICAPPGYGKTTLAAQYARQSSSPVAWHTLEERDRDVPNLCQSLLAALESHAPGLQDFMAPPGYTAAELAVRLTDYLRSNTLHPVLLVLDDTHVFSGASLVESFMQMFVERLPTHCHLVLSGRMLPNLPLTEMIARREVVAFGQDQLRFTVEEAQRLATETLGSTLPASEIEMLTARLEGWPAGIVLALHPLPSDLEQVMLHGGRGPEALFNALAASMLETQPPGLREFLLASSTLFRLTPELCVAVLDLPDSLHWLAEAQRQNIFLSRVAGGLVYHGLFRDFLQDQLRQDDPDLFVGLHMRAARWFEESDRVDESFTHYLAAGMFSYAASVAEQVADGFFAQGTIETLLRWRTQLGPHAVAAPRLLFNCGRIFTDRYSYEDADTALSEARQGFERLCNDKGLADVQLQRAFIKLQRGQYRNAIAEVAHFAADAPDGSSMNGRALNILGLAHLHLGEVHTAIAYMEQALRAHRQDGDAHRLANLLQDLSEAYRRQGRSADASACLQEVVALRRSMGSPGTIAAALNNLGYTYHLDGDYEQALATFQEGLSLIASVPNKRVESALAWSMGDVLRDKDEFEESVRLYNRALGLISGSEPQLKCSVMISCTTLLRWQGKPQEAAALAEQALALAEKHEIALQRATARAALWTALAQTQHPARAADHLDEVLHDLHKQDARLKLAWVYILRAHVALLISDRSAAQQALDHALDTGASLQPLAAEIAHSPRLEAQVMSHAAQYPDLVAQLRRLRGEPRFRPAVADTGTARESYSLRVVCLGRERIERDSRPLSVSSWRSISARELFFYLLFEGARSREQISLAFWPDNSAQNVRSNFHTTLYRARQALGDNVIVHEDGLYQINGGLDLWCDALELEKLARQARLLPVRDARTESLWRKAVELYKGDFLPWWDVEWAAARRQRLSETYLEALIGLATCSRARRDPKEAITVYRRALEVDPYREDVHRAIMTSYAEMGEKRQVLAHFEALRALLLDELGLEPSPETMTLARTLLE